MTEVELAKQLRASNYTCKGVSCDECIKTNYVHTCLMSDIRIYCDDILGDDNYINRLEKENAELKKQLEMSEQVASSNPALFIENCNLKAENEELKKENKELRERCTNYAMKLECFLKDEEISFMNCNPRSRLEILEENEELKARISCLQLDLLSTNDIVEELKEHCKAVDDVNEKMKCCANCKKERNKPEPLAVHISCMKCKNHSEWELAE